MPLPADNYCGQVVDGSRLAQEGGTKRAAPVADTKRDALLIPKQENSSTFKPSQSNSARGSPWKAAAVHLEKDNICFGWHVAGMSAAGHNYMNGKHSIM